jgi:hypothetical protein
MRSANNVGNAGPHVRQTFFINPAVSEANMVDTCKHFEIGSIFDGLCVPFKYSVSPTVSIQRGKNNCISKHPFFHLKIKQKLLLFNFFH